MKPNAIEMLSLFETEPEKFWGEVAKVVVPEPQHHTIPTWCHDGDWFCESCNKTWATHDELMKDGAELCPGPPKLPDAPEVIARKLKLSMTVEQESLYITTAERLYTRCPMNHRDVARGWIFHVATHPEDDVICCLGALDLWTIEKEKK